MKHILNKDSVVWIDNKFIGSKYEHTNIAKLDQSRIITKDLKGICGVDYQLKKGDMISFDRTNSWDLSYYKTTCGVEFKMDCGYDWFVKNN